MPVILTDLVLPLVVSIVAGLLVNVIWHRYQTHHRPGPRGDAAPSGDTKDDTPPQPARSSGVSLAHIVVFAVMIAVFFAVLRWSDGAGGDGSGGLTLTEDNLRWLARLGFVCLVVFSLAVAVAVGDGGGCALIPFAFAVLVLILSALVWIPLGQWCGFGEWWTYLRGGPFDCATE